MATTHRLQGEALRVSTCYGYRFNAIGAEHFVGSWADELQVVIGTTRAESQLQWTLEIFISAVNRHIPVAMNVPPCDSRVPFLSAPPRPSPLLRQLATD